MKFGTLKVMKALLTKRVDHVQFTQLPVAVGLALAMQRLEFSAKSPAFHRLRLELRPPEDPIGPTFGVD